MNIPNQHIVDRWRYFWSDSGKCLMSYVKFSKEHETTSHDVDAFLHISLLELYVLYEHVNQACRKQSPSKCFQHWHSLIGLLLRHDLYFLPESNNKRRKLGGWFYTDSAPTDQLDNWLDDVGAKRPQPSNQLYGWQPAPLASDPLCTKRRRSVGSLPTNYSFCRTCTRASAQFSSTFPHENYKSFRFPDLSNSCIQIHVEKETEFMTCTRYKT